MSEDYVVGYGRPPREHQFKPGQSANPKGRPKGSKNVSTILNAALNEKVTTKNAGGSKTMTKARASMTQLANKAASGDLKAVKMLLDHAQRAEMTQAAPKESGEVTAEERRTHHAGVIATLKERYARDGGKNG